MPMKYSTLFVLALLVVARTTHVHADLREAVYAHDGQILRVSVDRIDTLIRSDTDVLNFPGMIAFTGKLILPYGRGRHGGKEGRPAAISTDGGKSWQDLPPDSPFSDNVQKFRIYGFLRDGSTLYVDVFPLEVKSRREDWGGKGYHASQRITDPTWRVRRFSKSGELVDTFTTKVAGLPWKEASYENYGSVVELKNGDLLTAFQCHAQAPSETEGYTFTTFIARSTDGGKTFQHVQTFVPRTDGKKIGSQGLCEPDVALLPNGDLLCLMRSGSDTPLYQSRSKDDGKTWSLPVSIGWPGVKPRLRVLSNGVLACSSGRGIYGSPQVTYAMFSIDGTGEKWEAPFNFHTGPGCSYTWNLERNGQFYVIYSHSDFRKALGAYRLPYQAIKWAVLNVTKEKRVR